MATVPKVGGDVGQVESDGVADMPKPKPREGV